MSHTENFGFFVWDFFFLFLAGRSHGAPAGA